MNFVRHALAYAKRGKPVFPLKPGGKVPLTDNGFHDATTDRQTIAQWGTWAPEANVGLVTGAASGLLVLDVDADKGGEKALWELQELHTPLPSTVEVITGGGGRHLYFQWPGEEVRCSAGKLGDGLDVRGTGGYVVAPPSVTAGTYTWSVDCASELAEPPEWLLGLMRESAGRPVENFVRIAQGVNDGSRNVDLASLLGHLLRKNVDARLVWEIAHAVNARNNPPMSSSRVNRTVDSIAKAELRRRGG